MLKTGLKIMSFQYLLAPTALELTNLCAIYMNCSKWNILYFIGRNEQNIYYKKLEEMYSNIKPNGSSELETNQSLFSVAHKYRAIRGRAESKIKIRLYYTQYP